MKTAILIMTMMCSVIAGAQSPADTLHVGDRLPRISNMKPGVSEYMHYFLRGDSAFNLNHQRRTITQQVIEGKEMWVIHDRKQAPGFSWDATSYVDVKNFRPYKVTRKVKDSVEAFVFSGPKIEADPGAARNKVAGFSRTADFDLFNFETDTEMFRTLPLKKNYRVVIPFYHPGSKSAFQFTLYEVIGEESISLTGNLKIDCWKLKFHSNPSAILWLDKKTQQLVKQVFEFPNGMKAVKILTYESFNG